MDIDPALHDWVEDFPHENGNYINTCCHCHRAFIGHKRRVVCKVCATPILRVCRDFADADESDRWTRRAMDAAFAKEEE